MNDFWSRLTASQKYYLSGGIAFIAAVLFFQFGISPLWATYRKTIHAIAASERALEQMKVLGREYGTLKQRADAVQRVLPGRARGFSLPAYLEKKTGEIQLSPHVKYMNPAKGATTGPFEETNVEMRLDSITTAQLSDFLQEVESPKDLITIGRVSIRKMKESPEYLTATLQIRTYQPVRPGDR